MYQMIRLSNWMWVLTGVSGATGAEQMVEECGDDWKNDGVGVPRSKAVYTDAVRAGTVKGFARKASARVQGNCRRKHCQWVLGIAESVGAMDGREPTWKRQDSLVENGRKEWECLQV